MTALTQVNAAGRLSYRIDEACKETGLTRSTLYNLMRSGAIRVVRVGRVVLIPRAELERFLREGTN